VAGSFIEIFSGILVSCLPELSFLNCDLPVPSYRFSALNRVTGIGPVAIPKTESRIKWRSPFKIPPP
jgi:hypothetical protein